MNFSVELERITGNFHMQQIPAKPGCQAGNLRFPVVPKDTLPKLWF